jgi:TolB-like protein/Tfp pilus assembly protein PilF
MEVTKTRLISIDLNEFKLHIALKNGTELTLHFNSPSRRFYLSVIALVVNEMKRLGKITSIPLGGYHDLLALLNDTVGGSSGSSDKEHLLPRIYRKWQHALPNLEEAPLFKVLGRKKEYDEGTSKAYPFTEAEKDSWANLFEYRGSEENVRLKFAIDKIGAGLNDVVILYEGISDGDAWEKFISSLRDREEVKAETEDIDRDDEELVPPVAPQKKWKIAWPSRYRWIVLTAAIGSVLGAATWAIWKISFKPALIEVASIERMAFPLPDNPSIAVLPFVNMSDDPKQEFLSDGITENIITALSKVPRLFVISRQSTFFYKGKPVKVKQVSEELGIRYVLEGSVQRSAERIRISVQLIDALTGHHLWSGRYDRDLKDLFALQDEITIKVLTGVQVKLLRGVDVLRSEKDAEKEYYRGKQGLDCYLKLTEAWGYYNRWNIEDNDLARRMVEEAIAMCPENPMAYISLGKVYHNDYLLGNSESPGETLEKGIELAQKALAMDDSIASAHSLLCSLYRDKREYDKAIVEGERAVALNPSAADVLIPYANCLRAAGRAKEAIPVFQKAIRLNPFGPSALYSDFATVLRITGRFEEAVSAYKKAIQIAPDNIFAHINLAATYSMMGREKEARAEAAEVLRINPKFSLDHYINTGVASPRKDSSGRDRYINALRKAGLK